MMDIFYINLDKRADRKADVERQLASLNLNATRVSAVDGSQLSNQSIQFVNQSQFIARMKRPISNGEIGCAMSHRKIWQTMLDENIDFALILEDDVVIDASVVTLIHNTTVYQTFDFLNLSSNMPYNPDTSYLASMIQQGQYKRTTETEKVFKHLDWNNNWKVYRLITWDNNIICECDTAPALGSGYILSKKAAQQFLLASNELDVPIDYIWRYAGGMLKQGFLAQPLIIQKENDSNISGRDKKYKLSLKQKFNRLMLKQKNNPRKQDIKRMYG